MFTIVTTKPMPFEIQTAINDQKPERTVKSEAKREMNLHLTIVFAVVGILLPFALVDCIIGGEEARLGQVPWQVLLHFNRPENSTDLPEVCGGTIVDESHVITAAHCFFDADDRPLVPHYAYAGVLHGSSPFAKDEFMQAKKVLKFNLGNFTLMLDETRFSYKNDVAIVKTEPFELNDWVAAARLPEKDTNIAAGESLRISGFGITNPDAVADFVLRVVDVPLHDDVECPNHLGEYGYLFEADSMFCVGLLEGGKDACKYDSGGPVIKIQGKEATLMGIVSFSDYCRQGDRLSVHQDVRYFLDWIWQNW